MTRNEWLKAIAKALEARFISFEAAVDLANRAHLDPAPAIAVEALPPKPQFKTSHRKPAKMAKGVRLRKDGKPWGKTGRKPKYKAAPQPTVLTVNRNGSSVSA